MPKSIITDQEILEAALVGLQQSLASVDARIAEIRKQLGVRGSSDGAAAAVATNGAPPKRQMSAAARKRIAAAQKKRWAEYRKSQK